MSKTEQPKSNLRERESAELSELEIKGLPEINSLEDLERDDILRGVDEAVKKTKSTLQELIDKNNRLVKENFEDLVSDPRVIKTLVNKYKNWDKKIEKLEKSLFDKAEQLSEKKKNKTLTQRDVNTLFNIYDSLDAEVKKIIDEYNKKNFLENKNEINKTENSEEIKESNEKSPEQTEKDNTSTEEAVLETEITLEERLEGIREDLRKSPEVLADYESTLEMVRSSQHKDLFDEDFLSKINNFEKGINLAKKQLEKLKDSFNIFLDTIDDSNLKKSEIKKLGRRLTKEQKGVVRKMTDLKEEVVYFESLKEQNKLEAEKEAKLKAELQVEEDKLKVEKEAKELENKLKAELQAEEDKLKAEFENKLKAELKILTDKLEDKLKKDFILKDNEEKSKKLFIELQSLNKDNLTKNSLEKVEKDLEEIFASEELEKSAFQTRLAEAQEKFKTLFSDPKELTQKEQTSKEKLEKRFLELEDKLEKGIEKGVFAENITKGDVLTLAFRLKFFDKDNLNEEYLEKLEDEINKILFTTSRQETLEQKKESSENEELKELMNIQFKEQVKIEKDKEKIDEIASKFENIQPAIRYFSTPTKIILEGMGNALSIAMMRNNILSDTLNQNFLKKNKDHSSEEIKITLEEIKTTLEEYQKDLKKVEKFYFQFNRELIRQEKIVLQIKIKEFLNEKKNLISDSSQELLKTWQRLLDKDAIETLEELGELAKTISNIESKLEKPEDLATADTVPLETIKKSAEEILKEEGVVEISAKDILSILDKQTLNNLMELVNNDLLDKNDKNRDSFQRSLRSVIKEKLLKEVFVKDLEKTCSETSEQVYSLLKGAVEAEFQKELASEQAKQISKLATAGKIGGKILANIGLYAGIGIGAGAIIGSGGAAAVVAGTSIALSRVINKKIANSDIWKSVKQKASSFWDKTGGKLFRKEKPPVDTEKILQEVTAKIVNPETISAILSNQLRENSSQKLLENINQFNQSKTEAINNPNIINEQKFSESLDKTSFEFYRKTRVYLETKYSSSNLTEKELDKMALTMTLNFKMYQKNEMQFSEVLNSEELQNRGGENKYWLLNGIEKMLEIRNSEGLGAVLFGGALAYSVASTSSAGRVVSGAISGAGLGLMLENRFRKSDQEKLSNLIENIITSTEKKIFSQGVVFSGDLNKAQKDASSIKAHLETGILDNNLLLKNRAENFIVRVNQEIMKRYEEPDFSIDNLLDSIREGTKKTEKEINKNLKKILKDNKDRKLIFSTVGALAGAGIGYLGASLTEFLRTPDALEVELKDSEFATQTENIFIPSSSDAPEKFLENDTDEMFFSQDEVDYINAEKPIMQDTEEMFFSQDEVDKLSSEKQELVGKTLKSLKKGKIFTEPTPQVQTIIDESGKPLEVAKVYRASIYDLDNKEELIFTREEELAINTALGKGDVDKFLELITDYSEKGAIYEDLSTGQQYHESELSFVKDEVVDEDIITKELKTGSEKLKRFLNTESGVEKSVDNISENNITEDQYNEMLDIYNKQGREAAEDYIKTIKETMPKGEIKTPEVITAEVDLQDDSDSLAQEAENIVKESEKHLVDSLGNKRASEAYDWMEKVTKNTKLTNYEKEILADFKKDFTDQLLENKKISPELLKRIDNFKIVVEGDLL